MSAVVDAQSLLGCAGSLTTPGALQRNQRVDWGEFDPFKAVEAVQEILKNTADKLKRRAPPAASLEDSVRRRESLSAARQAAARGRLAELQRPRPQLGDDAGLFLSAPGALIAVCEADFGGALRHALWAAAMLAVRELPEDDNRSEKAAAIRRRGRPRVAAVAVGGRGGASAICLPDALDRAVFQLSGSVVSSVRSRSIGGAVFGHTAQMDDDACGRK